MQPYFQQHGFGHDAPSFARSWAEGAPWVLSWRDRLAGFSLSLPLVDHAFLHSVQIDPRHRFRGLGTLLMHHFAHQSWLAGYQELRLVVYADNPAQHWYQQLGYQRLSPAYVQTLYHHVLTQAPSPPSAPKGLQVQGLAYPQDLEPGEV
jgi:ribosomal protein S18 acetylase RimI-like enzyme